MPTLQRQQTGHEYTALPHHVVLGFKAGHKASAQDYLSSFCTFQSFGPRQTHTSGISLGSPLLGSGKMSIGEKDSTSATAHAINEGRHSLPANAANLMKRTQLAITNGKLTNRKARRQKHDEGSSRSARPRVLTGFPTLEDRSGNRGLAINSCIAFDKSSYHANLPCDYTQNPERDLWSSPLSKGRYCS